MWVKKITFLFAITYLVFSYSSFANHVWGGELEAICNGDGTYTVRLTQYIDCGRVSSIGSSQTIYVHTPTGAQLSSFYVNAIIKDTLPTIPNPCAETVAGTCIGRVVWENSNVTIPSNAADRILSYSSCCRNININNVTNPSYAGQIYTIDLPGTNKVSSGCNSAPNFNALPPSEICTNMPTEIDFSATDNDGDSLSYSFFTPYGDPNGSHFGGPPFPTINFEAPYSFNNPMNSGLSINPVSGLITGTPINTGLFTLGVVVEEFRNGVSIGKKVRDFTYTVVQCAPDFSVGEPQVFTCMNDPVNFTFNFDGSLKPGTTPIWDFGDPASGPLNTSNLFSPTHEYSTLGVYIATVEIEDSCGNTLSDEIEVNIVETVGQVDPPDLYCKGENATVTSTDAPCELTEWYLDNSSVVPAHIGCEYNFTMTNDSHVIYFEPFVDPNNYTVCANASQGWGTDFSSTAIFDAVSDITIKELSVQGDQFWSGCTNFNSVITVEQGGFIIAGPIFETVDCDGPTTLTGLDLVVPAGTGYELKIGGATLMPSTGGPIDQIGLVDFHSTGPFYNVVVQSNKKCARRDSVVVYSKPSTIADLASADTIVCVNSNPFIIRKTDSTSLNGTWSGLHNTDSLFTPNTVGVFNVIYSTDGNINICGESDTVQITVQEYNQADIEDNQGPFCINSGNPIISLTPNSTPNGKWHSSKNNAIDSISGELNLLLADTGEVTVYYSADSGICPAMDSAVLYVAPNLIADITTTDSTMCRVAGDFAILLSDSSDTSGSWSGSIQPPNIFSPSTTGPGFYTIIYNTSGVNNQCSNSDTVQMTVTEYTIGDIQTSDTSICYQSNPFSVKLTDSTTLGGAWKGFISSQGIFNPDTIPGTYKLKYVVGENTSCSDSDSITITIVAPDTAAIIPNGPFCAFSQNDTMKLTLNSKLNGNWNSSPSGIVDANSGVISLSVNNIGTYNIIYTTNNSLCPVSDTTEIEIVGAPKAEIMSTDTTICENSNAFNLKLSTNSNSNGTWSGIGTSSNIFNPTGLAPGTYTSYYITTGINNACNDTDSVSTTILANEIAVLLQPSPKDLCTRDSSIQITTLDTTGAGTWWTEPAGFINNGVFSAGSSPPGNYTIFYGITGLCGDTGVATVNVHPVLDPTIDSVPPLCEISDPVNLSAVDIGTWKINGTLNNGVFNPNILGPGQHQITNSINDNCPVSDTSMIEVMENPIPDFTTDSSEGCTPLTIKFTDISDSNALTTTWVISEFGDSVFTASQLDSLRYTFSEVGCYDVKMISTFNYGCKNQVDLPYQICTHQPPSADFKFLNTPYNIKDPLIFATNQSDFASSYQWMFEVGRTELITDQDIILNYQTSEQDTFNLGLIASNGFCSDTIIQSTIIYDFFTLYTPNAFSPNQDGLNDVFYPYGKNHIGDKYLFIIYNRWGNIVFESETPYEGWNGTYLNKGADCQQDTYVWKIIAKDQFEKNKVIHVGHVNLIR